MVIRILILFILVLLWPAYLCATPAVTSANESGSTITIGGTSFGSKSPAAPVFFDDFESGSNGAYLPTDSDWTAYQGNGGDYSNTTAYSGSLAAHEYLDRTAGTEHFITSYHTYSSESEMYYSYMSKVSGPISGVFKNGRITSSAGHYNTEGGVALSDHYGFYNNGFESLYQSAGDWPSGNAGNWMLEIQSTSWTRHELYRRDSTAGVTDGEVYARVGSENKYDTTAETRASGYGPYNMNSIILGMMVSGLGSSAHVYIDDVYVDNTKSRVELCESATWSLTVNCNPQPPTAWSATSITVTTNDSSLTGSLYVFVFDSDGLVNSTGYLVSAGSSPVVVATDIPNQSSGTTSVIPSATATDDVSISGCKWATTDIAYASMTNTMNNVGDLYTALSPANLAVSDGNTYTIYYACIDGDSNESGDSDSFSVANPSSSGSTISFGGGSSFNLGGGSTITIQ